MKQRNYAFDLLCGLCIVRMISLHVISSIGYRGEYHFGKVMAWTFFFICFFFFKAGYFNKGINAPLASYALDRAKRLLAPYLTWGIIGNCIYFSLLYAFPHTFARNIHMLRWSHLWTQSHFYGNPPVWFLFSFCMMYMCAWVDSRVATICAVRGRLTSTLCTAVRCSLFVVLPVASYQLWRHHNPLWLSLSNVPIGLFMFQLGHLWHQVEKRLPQHWFLTVSIALTILFLANNHLHHGEYDMSLNKWVQHPDWCVWNTMCALCGLSGILLSLRSPRTPVLCHIGEHSMVFFVMHYPIIHIYTLGMRLMHITTRHQWHHAWIMLAIIFAICFVSIPLIERVPILSGRWNKEKQR